MKKSLAELEALVDEEENWAEHFECEQPIYQMLTLDTAQGIQAKTFHKAFRKWLHGVDTETIKDDLQVFVDDLCSEPKDAKTILETESHYIVVESWLLHSKRAHILRFSVGIIKKQAEL